MSSNRTVPPGGSGWVLSHSDRLSSCIFDIFFSDLIMICYGCAPTRYRVVVLTS